MRKFLGLTVAVLLLGVFSSASAQTSARSASYESAGRNAWANRGLVTNAMELQILTGPTSVQGLSLLSPYFGRAQNASSEFGINIRHFRTRYDGPGNTTQVVADTQASWPIGFAFGPIDNLEVGMALPLYLSPSDFGDLPLWVAYRFKDGNTQIGVRLALYMPTATEFQMQLGLPVMVRAKSFRLDTGAFAHFSFYNNVITLLKAPLRMGWQVTPQLFAGFQSGLMFTLARNFFHFTIPAYGFVGYTVPTQGSSVIDIGMRFGFDHFLSFGDGPNDEFDLNDFSIAFGANFGIQF